MFRIFGVFIIALVGFTGAAQPINVNGKVSNKSGKPVANAIVTLAGQKLKDTTDAAGAYSLKSGTYLINTAGTLPGAGKISLIHGVVSLSLTKPAPVSIEMFDMKGKLLESMLDRPVSTGDFKFDVTAHHLAANIMIIRVSTGQSASIFRYFPIDNAKRATTSSIAAPSTEGGLTKLQAVVDSLKITAAGYMPNTTTISSYQGVVNVSLDSITLAKFSFFVTSLAGVQKLSNSQNGFGGDLRFGKTGEGAGLLGADSICQCLAEASMPGSKVKIWRAFLSVKKDATGKLVNAIDRIGKGPWYDRVGRLVSNTTSDLLHDRPNADAAIKNDLPNEFGVPNHQPDPTKAAVDNHQFITGSDSLGRLYPATDTSNPTCQDWTSSAANGGKPRCGLSWPRMAMPKSLGTEAPGMRPTTNMQSWLSVWDLFGCQAGTDLTESSMRGKPGIYTIGNGGGYGGFYCFALTP